MGCIIKNQRKSIFRLFLSVLTLSFIFSFYYSSYIIVDRYISEISSNVIITAIVRQDVPDDSVKLTLKNIKSFYWVNKAFLIKPEKGLIRTDSTIGGISQDLLPENPLPSLINVSIKQNYLNRFNLAKYNLLIKRIDAVDSTILRKNFADTVFLIKNQYSVLSLIIGIILGLIVIFITFLSLNPEFISLKLSITYKTGIKNYNQLSKAILGLMSVVVSISIAISSGILYLLWYLTVEELSWFSDTHWQVLVLNFCFVILLFGIIYLILYLVNEPKRIINENVPINNESIEEIIITDDTVAEPTNIEIAELTENKEIQKNGDIIEDEVEATIPEKDEIAENVEIENTSDIQIEEITANKENENTVTENIKVENWEDDIT
ncbi:MAG: hypothetical protein HZB41_11725 [Ignavibacteriae bacterium]|nr:hypothetical protein [Ignavibacteriota bacterium]